jgi:Ca-activated chloride channel family protein
MNGFKLSQAKQAARQLVSQLKATDRLAIVHFGGDVKSMDGVFCTESNKEKLLRYIDNIWDEGGTNIGAGLIAGRDLLLASASAFSVNRIIFMSDGQPTEGIQDSWGLINLTREIRAHGISVTSIGLGSDFNEDLMQGIASTGGGAYAYLQDAGQLATIFQKDLTQAATQVAHGVQLRLDSVPGVSIDEALGYRTWHNDHANIALIALPDFAAGQSERVVVKLRVNAPAAGATFDVANLHLDYTDLLKGARIDSPLTLSAHATDKADVVWANRDREATVFAARAQSAVNTQAAADALKNGDRQKANDLLQQNAYFFEEAAKVAGEQAVAQDKAELKQWNDTFEGARTDDEVQQATKGAKRKARLDFGLHSSTY